MFYLSCFLPPLEVAAVRRTFSPSLSLPTSHNQTRTRYSTQLSKWRKKGRQTCAFTRRVAKNTQHISAFHNNSVKINTKHMWFAFNILLLNTHHTSTYLGHRYRWMLFITTWTSGLLFRKCRLMLDHECYPPYPTSLSLTNKWMDGRKRRYS